ncbi:hypothetical protein [Azospirillum picis]|uniref:Uncharacterized protein n=1 Tax=Azospirillum picis TaxID=488438 RepID=A0ABU0MH15_9PROT|nr:hypothetical protein [Azospirillum picis]MBP2299023.1 hypothetical protein [Azospirillum picis]MDQ0532735.1 hypothetical protein [Azospirillum picis]
MSPNLLEWLLDRERVKPLIAFRATSAGAECGARRRRSAPLKNGGEETVDLEDQLQDARDDQKADDEDDQNGPAKNLEHEGISPLLDWRFCQRRQARPEDRLVPPRSRYEKSTA